MSQGLLPRLKQSLVKTRITFSKRLSDIFKGNEKPSEDEFAQLEELMISADIGYSISEAIIQKMRSVPPSEYQEAGSAKAVLRKILIDCIQDIKKISEKETAEKPFVIMVIGVNGSGKTTTVGKMAAYYREQGRSVILCAADTFRDAAIEQLTIWGERAGFRVIKHQQGADAAAVIFDSIKAAVASKSDYLIIDTAGRLHTKGNLMRELEKMQRIISREIPGAPHKIYLVIDANTGQNGIAQAREFLDCVNVTSLILAKMDGTARGGFVFGIKETTGLNVEFIGIGERLEDLVPFSPESFVDAIIFE